MKIGIVLPTVDGRGTVFDKVVAAYGRTRPTGWEFDIVVPENYATVGEAWNSGAGDVDADYVFFAIDDAEPHPGWAQCAVQTVDAGYVPAARLEWADGTLASCGSLGFGVLLGESPDCTPCRSTGIIFTKQDWIGEVGEFLPIHYGADDNWTWRAAIQGYPCVYRERMRFTHYHELASAERVRDIALDHHYLAVEHATTLTLPGRAIAALRGPVVAA